MSIMTVRAPDTLQIELAHKAKEMGLTRNALILVILDDWIKKNEKETNGQGRRGGVS